MKLGFLALVSPLCHQQPVGEVIEKRSRAKLLGVQQIQIDSFADNPFASRDRRAD